MWQALLLEIALKLAVKYGPVVADQLARMIVQAFEVVTENIMRARVEPDVVELAFKLAQGVVHDNPTMRPGFQQELIIEGIRILLQNPAVPRDPGDPQTLNAIAALALARAGVVLPPAEEPAA